MFLELSKIYQSIIKHPVCSDHIGPVFDFPSSFRLLVVALPLMVPTKLSINMCQLELMIHSGRFFYFSISQLFVDFEVLPLSLNCFIWWLENYNFLAKLVIFIYFSSKDHMKQHMYLVFSNFFEESFF